MQPIPGASVIFTDGSKNGCGVYMVDSAEPVTHQFPPGTPQHVELAIVVEVFKACSFEFNLISDLAYVINALKHLECAGPLKASSLVHALFVQLQCLLWQRKYPFFCVTYSSTYRFARPSGCWQ